jgi:hypothetical protein
MSPPEKRSPMPLAKGGHGTDENRIANVTVPAGGFTFKEFAGCYGVHSKTVSRWARNGKLVITRTPGGRPRIHGVRA